MGCLAFGLYWFVAYLILGAFFFRLDETSSESAWICLAIVSMVIAVVLMIPGRKKRTKTSPCEERTVEHFISEHVVEETDPSNLPPYEYEKFVAKNLLERGYRNAEVTQQSNDFGADILAVNSEGWRIAIQCKRYHGSVGISAVQEVLTGREYYDCDLAAVYTTGSYTQQAISLARKVHVKLYTLDKDGLRTAS